MKKLIYLSIIGLAVFAFAISASAAENWRLSGNYTITFTCTLGCGGNYVHTMNVSLYDNNDGTFSGTGYYNTNPLITWTVTGDVTGDTIGYLIDYNGSTYAVDADGTIAMDGTMSGTAIGPGQAFNWVMSPKATFYRYAEITSPAVDSIVTDTLNLGAFLMDNDYDPVQWAVRKGTCAAATNNIIGNVDGMNHPFNWAVDAGNKYKYVFSATANVTAWEEGVYCFIFNPSEDAGEADIRMTEFFKVNWDADNDGSFANVDCNDNDATIYPGAPDATCNGIDNDCDLAIDEDYINILTSCGIGACAASGELICTNGATQDTCTAGAPAANDATCDGKDDDCDATTDEDYVSDDSCFLPGTVGNQASSCTAGVETICVHGTYNWSGFFQPIDMGALNRVNAGRAIPVKFSLNGNMGLDIFATGYPKSNTINCDSTVPIDDVETTITAGGSSLTYDPIADQYIYVWKTEKSWVGTCRQLVVKLIDGTSHFANFKFK